MSSSASSSAAGNFTRHKPGPRPVTETIAVPPREFWIADELQILGALMWCIVIITLIGNMSCFYAVWKNWKKILEHPFFQSNVFCIILSVADVLLILLIGVPAAVFFTSRSKALGDGLYNKLFAEPIVDYLVWLQLLMVVAICVDRAGHICRPLTYTFSISAKKATIACLICISIPFIALTLPYIVVAAKTVQTGLDRAKGANITEDKKAELLSLSAYDCKKYGLDANSYGEGFIFMTCTLGVSKETLGALGVKVYLWIEAVANPLILSIAILALLVSTCLIVIKLYESAAFQKDNAKRQDEVARSVRTNSIVCMVQAVLLLVCTLPMRVYQIEEKLESWQSCEHTNARETKCAFDTRRYSFYYFLISKVLIFLGPMLNPWLYPIRMASIRSFLVTKRKSVVSSVNTSLSTLRSRVTMANINMDHLNQSNTVDSKSKSKNVYV